MTRRSSISCQIQTAVATATVLALLACCGAFDAPDSRYHLQYGEWRECSQPCGGGIMRREAWCVGNLGTAVNSSNCAGIAREIARPCNSQVCSPFALVLSEWSQCSHACGGGVATRTAKCHRVNLFGELLDEVDARLHCATELKDSTLSKSCNPHPCDVLHYAVTPWSECSSLCDGVRTRNVTCVSTPAIPHDAVALSHSHGHSSSAEVPLLSCKRVLSLLEPRASEACHTNATLCDILAPTRAFNATTDANITISAPLDALGAACAADVPIDACGVCNGTGRFVDASGICCTGDLDANGLCCPPDIGLDSCMVCGGTDSCAAAYTIHIHSETDFRASPRQWDAFTHNLRTAFGLAFGRSALDVMVHGVPQFFDTNVSAAAGVLADGHNHIHHSTLAQTGDTDADGSDSSGSRAVPALDMSDREVYRRVATVARKTSSALNKSLNNKKSRAKKQSVRMIVATDGAAGSGSDSQLQAGMTVTYRYHGTKQIVVQPHAEVTDALKVPNARSRADSLPTQAQPEQEPSPGRRRSDINPVSSFDVAFRVEPLRDRPGHLAEAATVYTHLKSALQRFSENSVVEEVSLAMTGICGNGICEVGERCSVSDIMLSSAACCAQDCTIPILDCPAVAGMPCNNAGACVALGRTHAWQGMCQCFPGYAGDKCDLCTPDRVRSVDGKCVPRPPQPSDAGGALRGNAKPAAAVASMPL